MRRLLLIFSLSLQVALAQRFPMRNYNMDDGLSHSTVYRIFQDGRGFMWFCTDYGLSCFDGRNFSTVDNDSLLYGAIISVSENKKGEKLISSVSSGIILMTDSALKAYPFHNSQEIKYILYAVERKGIVWAITRGPMSLFRVKDSIASEYSIPGSKGNKVLFSRIIEYPDELLFASDEGLYRLRDTVVEPFLQEHIKGKVSDIKRAADGTYWVSWDNKLTGIKDQKVIYSYDFMPEHQVGNILCDNNGNVWVPLYSDGIFLLHDGVMQDITPSLDMNRTFINDLCEDSEGNIWIATYDAGVYKISTLDQLNYGLPEEKIDIFCQSIAPVEDGKIVIGTIGKLYMWEKGSIHPVDFRPFMRDEFIYFAKEHKGTLYVGTPKGIYIKPPDGTKNRTQAPLPGIEGALCMSVDRSGTMWVGGYRNLFHMNEAHVVVKDTSSPLIVNKRINALYTDRKGNLWIGTTKGLMKYDGKNFMQIPVPRPGISGVIHAILEDSHGRIWAAAEGGLICVDKDTYKTFTVKNGLTHNKCNSLAEDNNNTLWVATLHGLSYVDLNTLDVKGYGAGIYPEEAISLYFSENNVLFVGTAVGLSSIKTSRVHINDAPPALYITSVKTSAGEFRMPAEIKVPYNDNKLRIDFIGLSFQNANTTEYRYKISNLNEEWVYTTNTSIELPALPSGDYVFRLNARKNKGSWSDDVSLAILVATPFWKTWWFATVLIVLIGSLIFLVTRWQIRKREKRKMEELASSNKELLVQNKIAHLKQQALGALINPHFIFNCMNSIQHYLNRNDNDKANSYLADFAQLIRITIEDAKEAFVDLNEEIARIRLYLSLEQLRFGNDLEYEIKIGEGLDPSSLRIPNMILQPYIENAIWHGIMPNEAKGNILISIERVQEGQLKVTIEDNGVGIKLEVVREDGPKKQRFGMKVTQERLQLLKQVSGQHYEVQVKPLLNESGDVRGTRVEILLPEQPLEVTVRGETQV